MEWLFHSKTSRSAAHCLTIRPLAATDCFSVGKSFPSVAPLEISGGKFSMFAHQIARFAVICGILLVANGCSHCGHHKHGVVDRFVDRCDDCNSGCTSCRSGHHGRRFTPQFGGEVYQDCSCGEAYHGDWKSHPPCADPCDCYGNHTGCANCCQDCTHLNRGRSCGLKGFIKSIGHGCGCDDCDDGCTSKGCKTCGY